MICLGKTITDKKVKKREQYHHTCSKNNLVEENMNANSPKYTVVLCRIQDLSCNAKPTKTSQELLNKGTSNLLVEMM